MGLMTALNAAVSGLRTTQDSINLVVAERRERQLGGLYPPRHVARATDRRRPDGRRARGRDRARARCRGAEAAAARDGRRVLHVVMASYAGAARPTLRHARRRGRARHDPQHLHAIAADAASTIRAAVPRVPPCSTMPASSPRRSAASRKACRRCATDAEGRIGLAVDRANELLSGIAGVNARIVANQSASDPGAARRPRPDDQRALAAHGRPDASSGRTAR